MPVLMDMRYLYPIPVYYSYCVQQGLIDPVRITQNQTEFFPCVICGEKGTARSSIAFLLYQIIAQPKHIPSYRVDCSLLTLDIFYKLFYTYGSVLNCNECFLFLYEVQNLTKELQKQFLKLISSRNCWIVACSQASLQDYLDTDRFIGEFAKKISLKTYYTPPLRNNKNNIETFCYMLLNYYNAEYSKHVVGFDPQAISAMKKFDWTGNINQLSRIVGQLVMYSKDQTISELQTLHALAKEQNQQVPEEFWLRFDSSMTLNQITAHVVENVLTQENWNQTRTARRLGISRSTLWRIMQSFNKDE